jgi:hypothetical protein
MVYCTECLKEAVLPVLKELGLEVANCFEVQFVISGRPYSYFETDSNSDCFVLKRLYLSSITNEEMEKSQVVKTIAIKALANAFCQHLSPIHKCEKCVDTWLKHVIIPEFKAVVEFLGGKLSPEFKVICDRKQGRGSISNIAYVEFEKGRRALKLLAVREAHIVPLIIDKKKRIEVLTHEALHSLHQKHTRKFREVEKRAIREVQSSIDKICVKWYNTDSFLN